MNPDEGDMYRRKRLNLLNILYYYVQRCIASSNNSNLDIKSHLSTEIVLQKREIGKLQNDLKVYN